MCVFARCAIRAAGPVKQSRNLQSKPGEKAGEKKNDGEKKEGEEKKPEPKAKGKDEKPAKKPRRAKKADAKAEQKPARINRAQLLRHPQSSSCRASRSVSEAGKS